MESWVWRGAPKDSQAQAAPQDALDVPENLVLPLLVQVGRSLRPASTLHAPRKGGEVILGLFEEKLDEARTWLEEHGWERTAVKAEAGSEAEETPEAGGARG